MQIELKCWFPWLYLSLKDDTQLKACLPLVWFHLHFLLPNILLPVLCNNREQINPHKWQELIHTCWRPFCYLFCWATKEKVATRNVVLVNQTRNMLNFPPTLTTRPSQFLQIFLLPFSFYPYYIVHMMQGMGISSLPDHAQAEESDNLPRQIPVSFEPLPT